MITLQQGRCTVSFDSLGSRIKDTKVKIDKSLLDNDIEVLNKKVVSTNKMEEIDELREAILYLNKIRNKDEITLKWDMSKGYLSTVDNELKSFDTYNIYCTDYITLENTNKNIIRLNYSKLADAIAFEIMFKDLGFTREAIEEKLKDIGIVEVTDADRIEDFLNQGAYKLSKSLNIIDSPYKSLLDNTITDYFWYKSFKGDKYKEAISFSCRRALSMVLSSIVNSRLFKVKEIDVYALNDTTLYIGVYDGNRINDINLDTCIRLFGRRFDIAPTIQIY